MSPVAEPIAPVTSTEDPSPDLGNSMDEFFSAGADEGGSDEPPAPETEDAPPPDGADATPPPAPAKPAAAETPLPDGAVRDGKQIRIDAQRFDKAIYPAYKYAQEVQQFAPTVQDAQVQYQRASDLRHMHSDFTSADPAQVDEFLKYWESQSPAGFATMTQRALERAPQAVREQLASQSLQTTADSLYEMAAQSGDPQDLYKAQMFEWSHSGQFRFSSTDQLPKVDPLAKRQKELDARENTIRQQESQRGEQAWSGWKNQTDQAIGSGLNQQIDTLLKEVAPRFKETPDLWNAVRQQIRTQVISKVEADSEWMRNFNLDYRRSRGTMSPGDRQALVQGYLSRANPVLSSIAKPLISQATRVLVQKNQEAHDRLANGQFKRGGAASGAPTRQSLTPQNDRQSLTLEQKIDRDMDIGIRP